MDAGSPDGTTAAEPVLARLMTMAEETAELDLDVFTDDQLERCLDGLRRPLAILEATRSRLLASLEVRATRRVQPGGNARGAKDEQRRRSAERHRLSRSRAKREAEAGHAADLHRATGAAFSQGDIGPEHVGLIAELLAILPAGRRDEAEARLLVLAREYDPVSFGRRGRALLQELAPQGTAENERRQESRRQLRMADTPDGGLALSGRLHGTSAELARVAIDAFRRFDAPDEPRTVEQRNADAFLQLCEVALKAEQAPTKHGARPHVVVLVRAEDLDGGAGAARFGHSGQPVNLAQARRLFSDSIVSRLVLAADGTPIEASAGVRTVPAGLFRALVARDGGCTWQGCAAPPSWCEVAHGNVPFRENQPLRLGDAALLCRRHHRRFDLGNHRMVIEGGDVHYLRLDAAGHPLGEQVPGRHGPVTDPSPGTPGPTRHHTGSGTSTPASEDPTRDRPRERPVRDQASRRSGAAPPPASPNAPPRPPREGSARRDHVEGAARTDTDGVHGGVQPSLLAGEAS